VLLLLRRQHKLEFTRPEKYDLQYEQRKTFHFSFRKMQPRHDYKSTISQQRNANLNQKGFITFFFQMSCHAKECLIVGAVVLNHGFHGTFEV
jgi:hypothetical protein